MTQASSGKNITPVCISIEQSRGSPESKECLGIDIKDQPLPGSPRELQGWV